MSCYVPMLSWPKNSPRCVPFTTSTAVGRGSHASQPSPPSGLWHPSWEKAVFSFPRTAHFFSADYMDYCWRLPLLLCCGDRSEPFLQPLSILFLFKVIFKLFLNSRKSRRWRLQHMAHVYPLSVPRTPFANEILYFIELCFPSSKLFKWITTFKLLLGKSQFKKNHPGIHCKWDAASPKTLFLTITMTGLGLASNTEYQKVGNLPIITWN